MLKKGDKIPDFTLKDQNGEDFAISSLLGKKTMVIYFYPKDETPGCTAEACAFRDQYEDFTDAGAEVIGISKDSVESHQNFARSRNLPFILLSDPQGEVFKQFKLKPGLFGLLMPRVTFVVDREGVIRQSFESQLQIKKHIESAKSLIQSLNVSENA